MQLCAYTLKVGITMPSTVTIMQLQLLSSHIVTCLDSWYNVLYPASRSHQWKTVKIICRIREFVANFVATLRRVQYQETRYVTKLYRFTLFFCFLLYPLFKIKFL